MVIRMFAGVLLCALLPLTSLRAQGKSDAVVSSSSLSFVLDSLITYHLPAASHVGLCAYDLTAGKLLYTYQADHLCRPASTMKLLTGITALSQPEADTPFRTEVWYRGEVRQDTLRGDLYVVGGFDPEFDEAALDSLVSAVAALPFHTVQGRLLGDVSLKDSLYWGSGWMWDDNPAAFQPYLSPLMLCKGKVVVTAHPADVQGETARLQCVPRSSYYTLQNETATRTPAAGRFRVSRNWLEDGNRVTVSGNVTAKQTGEVNLYASQCFFMHTFTERLRAAGVQCDSVYAFDVLCRDSLAHFVACHETPVQQVFCEMMKESDNLNAEALLCRLGMQTTGRGHVAAEDGLEAIRKLINQLGYQADDYNLADGCGLSAYNYLSPSLLVAFLRYAHIRADVFGKLYEALPVGGVDGTLQHRMKQGTLSYRNVHAKTGSFTGISTLAGYLRGRDGHLIAFAVMNQNVLSSRKARAFQDKVCEALIRFR